MIILYLLVFALLCFALIKSGEVLVKVLMKLSQFFRATEFVLAFILITLATTLPELVVGVMSGIRNNSVISLGNVIGANFINLTFVLGLVAVIGKGVKVETKIVKRDAWIIFFVALLPLLLLFDKRLSRAEGFLLLIVFGWYVWHLLKSKEAFKHRVHSIFHDITGFEKFLKTFLFFLAAAAILILSAWGLVEIAKLVAVELYVPLALVSVILVAFGTSLPEMVFGIKAAVLKHEGMCLGNLIGAVVVNSTFILGLTALISPIQIENFNAILIGGFFMMLAILLANIFLSSGRRVSVKEGWILIGFYALFLIAEFLFK